MRISAISFPASTTGNISTAGDAAYGGTAPTTTVYELISTVIQIVFGFLGVVFLVLMLYAGFLWMTAAGESKRVDKAKSILGQSTIGLLICLAAYTVSYFIVGAFGFAVGLENPF